MDTKKTNEMFVASVLAVMLVLALATFYFSFQSTNTGHDLKRFDKQQAAQLQKSSCITQIRSEADYTNALLLQSEAAALVDIAVKDQSAFNKDVAKVRELLSQSQTVNDKVKNINTICSVKG